VLARWDHPLTGIVTPDRFIGIAEEHNLIGRLSDQVFRKALAAAADWDPSTTLSINISPRQFSDSWLAQKIVRLLAETGFPAERLVVEVTESSLFADIDLARTIVHSLKNQGIALALDDFGSGFSSLSHLSALPFDKIKIDRTFVATVGKDRQSAAIVRAVTTMAQALDVPVVAEGIEDAEAHAALLQMGCTSGQGWYFGKPMQAEDAEHLLRHSRALPSGAAPVLPVAAKG
jgi:EAL domain-containing protein (putative c-di-GMP-specific phosphodiesterase class I)